MPERFVAGEGRRERTGIQLVPILIGMIVQCYGDSLAGNHVIPAVWLVIEHQPATGAAIEPAVDSFKGCLIDILKVAILFKDP